MSIPEYEALTEHTTIADMVRVYQEAEADIRAGFGLVKRGMERVNESTRLRDVDVDNPDETASELRRAFWRSMVTKLQMERAMSVKQWNEFDQKLRHDAPPPVTVEIVEGMVRQFRADLPEMLQRSVKEMFEWLRPRDSEYKTNSEYEIGKRVVLNGVIRRGYLDHWDVNYHYEQDLRALENVFLLCDCRVVREKASHYSDLSLSIKACPVSGPCRGETEYFRFSGYKKGTIHLEFKRPELVAKLNAIAGGMRLKPSAEGV